MAHQISKDSRGSKKVGRFAVILVLIIVLALLAICFKDQIFTSGFKGEGSLLVTGQGKDLYYVFSAKDNRKIDFTSTGKTIVLPAGHYKITLHNAGPMVTVRENKETVVFTGILLVEGLGQNLYEVWDQEKETKLDFAYTGRKFEIFPGAYTVVLNGIQQKVTVRAEDTTRVASGRLIVTGRPDALYYVYDQTGNNQLQFTSIGKETELLPGTYWVRVDKDKQQVDIIAGEVIEVAF